MDSIKKRKEWIKNVLIIFLVVLLILTFCSNTIMNMYLPEVSCESVIGGKLQDSIRGTGNAELNQAYEVKVNQSRKVKEVKVKVGDEIKVGQVLFTLDEGDSTELETAKSTYLDLKIDYEKRLLGTSYDYQSDELAIEAAKRDYEKAAKAYKNVGKNNKNLTKTEKELNDITAKIEKTEKKITDLDAEIADLVIASDDTTKKEDVTAKKRALVVLNNELTDLDADLLALKNSGTATKEEITEKERERRNKAVEVENAKADVTTAEEAVKECSTSKTKLTAAKKSKEDYENKLGNYRNTQTTLTTKVETLKASALSKEDAKAAMDEKENAYNSLIAALEVKKNEDNKTSESDKIELKAAKDRLEAQKKIVEDMEKQVTEPDVKAEMAGTVSEINVTPGSLTTPEEALMTITSGGDDFVVKVSVSTELSKKVKVGQTGEVVNYWGDVAAILRSIATDTENPNNSILTFEVKGEYVSAGDSMTISVGGENKDYELIAPKSAIHEDNNGKFVLALETKNTPLGTRYIAKRHDVEVLAENDTRVAISTDLYGNEYVITTASALVNAGDQVKIKED